MASEPRISGYALRALLPQLSAAGAVKYTLLADAIQALVLDGRIAAGTRLPSERELSSALALSRATVTSAYDALRERGYLASRTGSGSFVTMPQRSQPRRAPSDWPPGTWLADREQIDLTLAALPAPPGTVVEALAIAAQELPAHVYGSGGYDAVGLPALRRVIAERYAQRGVPTDPEQLIITNGALHGFDLLLRLLITPGDRVLTELPTYAAALDAIRASAGRLLPVPVPDGGGWDIAQMTAVLKQGSPKLAYLIPDYQNPLGTLVDDAAREQLIAVARTTSTTVVVDETFVGLGFGAQATPAAAFDPAVLSIGSLSKSVWGGLRIGWIRAPEELVRRLAALRASIDLSSAVIDQLVAVQLVPGLDQIVADRVAELSSKRGVLLAALARELPEWNPNLPDGGLALWVELDAPLSTTLTLLARSAGINLVPGSRFGIDGTLERFLRLPYALEPPLLEDAVGRLASIWRGLDRRNLVNEQMLVA